MTEELIQLLKKDWKDLSELEKSRRVYGLYDYYGIDYYTWDGDEDEDNQSEYEIEKDIKRMEAVTLILEGKSLPEELATKLLQYKAEEEKQR